ncbi:MAG: translocation/assembly module TamB domain-containing protein, partial [Vulcanococcus sp.]
KAVGWDVSLPRLLLRQGGGELRLAGELLPRLELRSQSLRLGPRQRETWGPLLGPEPQVAAVLRQVGGWSKPQLRLDLQQSANPLLGALRAQLSWRPGQIRLERFSSATLQAQGLLRLERRLANPLQLSLDLQDFPLARLSPLLGTRLQGQLDARGQLRGRLEQLSPDLALRVERPGVGPLAFSETWQGHLAGTHLQLTAEQSPLAGRLRAQLDRRWLPTEVRLERGAGLLQFSGSPRRYSWTAHAFPLRGLSLALWPQAAHQPLAGLLFGKGLLDLQPLWIRADVAVQQPQLLGLFGRQLQAKAEFRQRRFELTGRWSAFDAGSIGTRLKGEQGGPLWLRLEGRSLSSRTLQELIAAAPQWQGQPFSPGGQASDLRSLAINAQGWTIAEQLQALALAQQQRQHRQIRAAEGGARASLQDLQGLVDADLTLVGTRPERLFIDLAGRGHLWLRGVDRDQALTDRPLQVRLKGPLNEGGTFDVQQVPLALLALFAPVPDGLAGAASAQGRYRLARAGRRPELELDLSLEGASLASQPLQLERGEVRLQGDLLKLDWQLRSGGSAEVVDLKGQVPLVASQQGLELRMGSRGDGLRFLSALAGPGLQWRQGSADLQLLVRGSLLQPVANGFLRFSDGDLELAGQRIQDLDAIFLFDFSALELQSLTARVGQKGRLSASGTLPLFRPSSDLQRRVRLSLVQTPFRVARMAAQADGDILIGGTLLRPVLSGEVALSNGAINVQPGQLATEEAPTQPVSMPALLESNWDFSQPLLVMGQQLESTTSQDLRAAVPSLRFLSFNGLRLRFGNDLRVEVPNVLNFRTAGLLTLNGPMDPSIRISGVVRLLSGRLGLFTTTFSLDPDSPNVAVFTSGLGLIPYLDVVLRTRVSDSLPVATGTNRSSIYDWNLNGSFSSFDQLRLVRVRVEIAGPADRLAQSIRLSSTPPLPEDRLLALVGGNSLVGLVGGNAGAALATVVGQSLLSPVVGSLTELLGQRLTFALYPTYVLPVNFDAESNRSGQVPSQLVLASDIGLDITERFNASVLAAPNRSDIAPQMTLRYQAQPWLGIQTSIDTESRWQTQMQLFFRF